MLSILSNGLIPMIFFIVILYSWKQKEEAYDYFLEGVQEGFRIVYEITPTLIGLMLAVGMMRASGLMDEIIRWMKPVEQLLEIPSGIIPVIFTKLFSSSAATGLLLDILKTDGPDSKVGFLACLILSSTETVFYTMSVYFGYVNIKKTRWTLAGALFCILAGTMASIVIYNKFL